MSRPIGVIVVAIVMMVSGVFVLLLGLEGAGITKFGLAPLAPNNGLYAPTVILSGVLSLIAAFGLFTMARWAWYLAVIVLTFRVIADAFGVASWALSSVPGGVTILDLAVTAVLLWYFFRPHVKAAFNVSNDMPPPPVEPV
jgi:hypothetical protein